MYLIIKYILNFYFKLHFEREDMQKKGENIDKWDGGFEKVFEK
jgi:hypothetical protein